MYALSPLTPCCVGPRALDEGFVIGEGTWAGFSADANVDLTLVAMKRRRSRRDVR